MIFRGDICENCGQMAQEHIDLFGSTVRLCPTVSIFKKTEEDIQCPVKETGKHTMKRQCRLDKGHKEDHRFGRRN